MFNKSKSVKSLNLNDQEIATLIGYGYSINGEITGKSVIRVDGTVIGDVTAEAGLILGEKGKIIGNIKSKSVVIFGIIEGNIVTSQLEIKKTGQVKGDIKTDTLEIELGAQYNGQLEMKELIKKEDVVNLKAV